MKILLTGHQGYIGAVMAPLLVAAGHDVVGLDSGLFAGCAFGPPPAEIPTIRKDIRNVERADLAGFEAVVHLAALSNDPLGDLNPEITYDINHRATVRLAQLAKEAGASRFIFASSCSLYGAAGDAPVTEESEQHPVTAYGDSKIRAERDLMQLADDRFSPTYMRNATAYGASPALRLDIVVNNLVGYAHTTGEVTLLSDGTAWRPLVHIEDISRAVAAVLAAPRELVHNQAFNVGSSSENYQIRDIANLVSQAIPGCAVKIATGSGADTRCYQVDCGKITRVLNGFECKWNVPRGIQELAAAYSAHGLTTDQFHGSSYLRIKRIKELQADGRLDDNLRWR